MKQQETIDPAFRDFDQLPDSAYVDLKVVMRLRSCSSATVWRDAKNGRIPKPHKLSIRNTRWNVGELRKVLSISEAT